MLKSVYTNGGFWIGRYEGSSGAIASAAPLSQPNKSPQILTCREAQVSVAKVATTDSGNTGSNTYTSSLMFGVQWDLVCKFLEKSTEWPDEHEASWYIKIDSSSWGYYDSYPIACTGSSTDYKRMNIYDFAGNVYESTLEHLTTVFYGIGAVGRGGLYEDSGDTFPASCRDFNFAGNGQSGFRVSLY